MFNNNQKSIIYNIISEQSHGKEFYTSQMFDELIKEVEVVFNQLELFSGDDESKINKVNDYLMNNVSVRKEYFDAFREAIPEIPKEELKYRTGYAVLIDKQGMCAGYTEAARILLELSGLKTQTLLSKLPGKNKRLLHYVTAIKYNIGAGREYYIMDSEREKSCKDKGFDFKRYLMEMTYIKPNDYFFDNKVGKNGVGPSADEFLEKARPLYVRSKNNVDQLFCEEIREMI